jgi:hypothetical protein
MGFGLVAMPLFTIGYLAPKMVCACAPMRARRAARRHLRVHPPLARALRCGLSTEQSLHVFAKDSAACCPTSRSRSARSRGASAPGRISARRRARSRTRPASRSSPTCSR